MTPLEKIQLLLTQQNLDAVLISSVSLITYLTGFSSFSPLERDGYVFITKKQRFILTNSLYAEAVKKAIPDFTLLMLSRQSSWKEIFTEVLAKEMIQHVGIEPHNLTVAEYDKFSKLFPQLFAVDLDTIRMVKTTEEIASIQTACQIGDKAFTEVVKQIQPGITEKRLAFLLEIAIKEQNADLSFPTIVAFGENSVTPHHQTSENKLKKNDLILIDFGVKYHNYCSDMTRTFFIGTVPEKLKKMYEVTINAQQKAVEYITSTLHNNKTINQSNTSSHKQIHAASVDNVARTYIEQHGFPTIPHSLGHGIGLDVHEAPSLSPKSADILSEGMIFSIEPGIYLPGIGGIRIEDLYAIQNNKLIQLTHAPRNFITL